jgi:hypothetical protein
VNRRLPLHAEIFLRLDDAVAEVHLPEAIHGDARGQRMVRIDEPSREREAVERRILRQRRQHRRHTRLHLFGLVAIVAAREHEGVARFLQVRHHHCGRNALLEVLFLLVQRLELGQRLAERLRRGMREKVLTNLCGLRRRALAEHAGNDDASRIVNREIDDLSGLEDAAVDPQVVDLPEERRAEAPAPDRQRSIGGHRPR